MIPAWFLTKIRVAIPNGLFSLIWVGKWLDLLPGAMLTMVTCLNRDGLMMGTDRVGILLPVMVVVAVVPAASEV